MKRFHSLGLSIGLFALLLAGCERPPESGLPTVKVQLGSKTFTLEVADTEAVRSYGLMRRDSMPADGGMIFVFKNDEPRSFWMKNTRIPLDIVFVNSQGQVVAVASMKPYDLNTTHSVAPAKFAIELNQGAAGSAGVQAGMSVKIPPGLDSKD